MKDITNKNSKEQYHGYQEWYNNSKLINDIDNCELFIMFEYFDGIYYNGYHSTVYYTGHNLTT